MRQDFLEWLVDPISSKPLTLHAATMDASGRIESGELRDCNGGSYPVVRGIPRFTAHVDGDKAQVSSSFGYKWNQRQTFETDQFFDLFQRWAMDRYGFANEAAMRGYFASRKRILDVGCGAGMGSILSTSGTGTDQLWVGADLSSAIDVAYDRMSGLPNTQFVQADLMRLPFRRQTFDTIYAEGVLHHTPSTEAAIKALVPLLQQGGEMLFYIYRKKGPIREFADDSIRDMIAHLPPQEAWAMLRPLTQLGKALSDLHAEIEVPEDIPYLGIKAGRHDVQRLIYWHFAKLYWNDRLSFEENNHVNFDWYHPRYAFRQTEEEVRRWCAEAGLAVIHFHEQESGFTVRASKNAAACAA